MRLGIFSDVHANLEAMTAVVHSLKSDNVDQYFCLGDVVGYGASPNECSDIIRQLAKVTILGNHDAAVAGRMDYSYYYEEARHALDVHSKQVSKQNLDWLKSLPYRHDLIAEGVTLCHGSPVRIEDFDYIFQSDQAHECLSIWDGLGDITFIGHSHLCKVFALKPGEPTLELEPETFDLKFGWKYIVSVGSVGQPRDGDPRASYGVYDSTEKRFEFKRVEYDVESAAQKIFDSSIYKGFGHRLFSAS